MSTYDKYINKSLDTFLKYIFNQSKQNAKKRKINFDITLDNIKELYKKQKGLCTLTAPKLTYHILQKKDKETRIINKNNISIDRIDFNKNYTKNNIQLITAQ